MSKKIAFGLFVIIVVIIVVILATLGFFRGDKNGWSSKEVVVNEPSPEAKEASKAIDCNESKNSEVTKEITIKLADINDKAKYKAKRAEAVGLINQCYEVKLKEEYEVQAGEISMQEGIFKNKVSTYSRVFDKLTLYPTLELFDYESVALDAGLTYVFEGDFKKLSDYYLNTKVENYKQIPSPSENELLWVDNEKAEKILSIKFSHADGGKTFVTFDFIQPLAVE